MTLTGDPATRGPRGGFWIFVPGALVTALGVLILLNENLLRYLVAAFFLIVGLVLLSAAWQIRNGQGSSTFIRVFQSRFRGPFDGA